MILQTRKDFTKLLALHNCKIGIELGVAKGVFSKYLVDNYIFDKYYCVDSWNSRIHQVEEYVEAYNRLKESKLTDCKNIMMYRASFEEIISTFPDKYFDFIYIDGYAHTGQEGGKTIEDWYCKLKPGGIYAGHDYHTKYILTKENVDRHCQKHNLTLNLTVKNGVNEKWCDRLSSWWVIKQ